MTSSIFPPRRVFAPCSPMTQASASTTLDLPDPFGPTTAVIPGSNRRVVDDAKDLNPRRVRLFRCMQRPLSPDEHSVGEVRLGGYLPGRDRAANPPTCLRRGRENKKGRPRGRPLVVRVRVRSVPAPTTPGRWLPRAK